MVKSEAHKIVEFVREQRHMAPSRREWKRRLAVFGFSIERPNGKAMIMALPDRVPVCAVPRDLRL